MTKTMVSPSSSWRTNTEDSKWIFEFSNVTLSTLQKTQILEFGTARYSDHLCSEKLWTKIFEESSLQIFTLEIAKTIVSTFSGVWRRYLIQVHYLINNHTKYWWTHMKTIWCIVWMSNRQADRTDGRRYERTRWVTYMTHRIIMWV